MIKDSEGNFKKIPNCEKGFAYVLDISKYKEWISGVVTTNVSHEFSNLAKVPSGQRDPIGLEPQNYPSKNFTLINNTGSELLELYISPDFAPYWGYNLLHSMSMLNDSQFNVHITDRTCYYLFKAKSKTTDFEKNINICENDILTIK